MCILPLHTKALNKAIAAKNWDFTFEQQVLHLPYMPELAGCMTVGTQSPHLNKLGGTECCHFAVM